jgi:hypothetical protein
MDLCAACNTPFAGTSAFDRHRTGRHEYTFSPDRPDGRRCMDEAEMREAGLELDPKGRWYIVADRERVRLAFGESRRAAARA